MVPSDRAVATAYKLTTVTMFPSAAVWPQFLVEAVEAAVSGNDNSARRPNSSHIQCCMLEFCSQRRYLRFLSLQ